MAAVGLGDIGWSIDTKAGEWLKALVTKEIKKTLMKEVAEYWHTNIFPRAFTPGNEQRLGIEARTEFYKKVIKPKAGVGQGKYVAEVLTGRSKRAMLALATITSTSGTATVRMRPPRYFTNPFIGTFIGTDGTKKRITQQPDKPKEITTVTDRHRQMIVAFAEKRLNELVEQ